MADGTSHCVDNYTLAPGAATPDMYRPISDEWPDYLLTEGRANQVGHLAVGVPGNLKAWDEVHERFGRLSWEAILSPSIRYARAGFRCSEYLSRLAVDNAAGAGVQRLEIAVQPRSDGRQFNMLFVWNGVVVHEQPIKSLSSSSGGPLETMLVVDGARTSVNVSFDNYHLERRKDG